MTDWVPAGYCEEHDEKYDLDDPKQVAAHTHPETLTKQQLRDALVLSGWGDTAAWSVADEAFIVSMEQLERMA